MIYIAGPISADIGIPLEEKIQRFHDAEASLRSRGHEVINPLTVETDTCPGECNPDGHVGQEGVPTHSWACFMRHDIRALLLCDTIALLPGWETSPGARLEVRIARELGMAELNLELENIA